MPSFRALPPSLRHTPPHVDPTRIPVPAARATIDCAVYGDGQRVAGTFTHADALARCRELQATGVSAFVWIGLHEPDQRQMQSVADLFGLHPLTVEDAVHAHQRPKLERYDDRLFLVLKTVKYVPHESATLAREIVETGEIMVFVGPDFVITVRHGDHSGLAALRRRMDADGAHLRLGPGAVMHAIAHQVVDTYLDVSRQLECDIDDLEENTFSPRHTSIEQIYLLKREVLELRRAVAPLTVALQRMMSDHRDLVGKEVLRYMRDVLDHQTRAETEIVSYDEMLTSLVQAALAKVGMEQNTDMRKISAWVAIAAVPTMLAGIYGMNFDNMPELHWSFGYPLVLLMMVTVCGVLFRTFRRNHWL